MFRTRVRVLATIPLLMSLITACDDVNGPSAGEVRPGILQLIGSPVPMRDGAGDGAEVGWTVPPGSDVVVPPQTLTAPDTVAAGEPFQIRSQTIGESGCWSAQRQDVVITGRTVEVQPFDVHSGARVCTEILLALQHVSTVNLAERGEWTIRVSGRRVDASGLVGEQGVAAEKRIVVR